MGRCVARLGRLGHYGGMRTVRRIPLLLSLGLLGLLGVLGVLGVPAQSWATVTSSTTSVTYDPSTATTEFSVTFPFQDADQLTVVRITEATGAETTLTNGINYTVALPAGTANGSVTLTSSIGAGFQLRITRSTDVTQEVSFIGQGSYSAYLHEYALDKLTMLIQETRASTGVSGDDAVSDHVGESDPHSQYALLAGRGSGQVLYGGQNSGGTLTLYSNQSNDGFIRFAGGMFYDEAGVRLGIGTGSPAYDLDLDDGTARWSDDYLLDSSGIALDLDTGSLTLAPGTNTPGTDSAGSKIYGPSHALVPDDHYLYGSEIYLMDKDGNVFFQTNSPNDYVSFASGVDLYLLSSFAIVPDIYGGDDSGEDLTLSSNNDASDGHIYLGAAETSAYDETNDRLGIGDATPDYELDVEGDSWIAGWSRHGRPLATASSTPYTVSASDCNGVIKTAYSGTMVIGLPDISELTGCQITVVATSSAGTTGITMDPDTGDAIYGACIGASTPPSTGLALEYMTGTSSATVELASGDQQLGDTITLTASDDTYWTIDSCYGLWDNP